MTRNILLLISRWLLPTQISIEKRLAAMRDTNHELERAMARRVYARLRSGRYVADRASGADTVL
jgi:hypothetical protein